MITYAPQDGDTAIGIIKKLLMDTGTKDGYVALLDGGAIFRLDCVIPTTEREAELITRLGSRADRAN